MMKKCVLFSLIALSSAMTLRAQNPPASTARLVIRSGLVEVQRNNAWQAISIGVILNDGEHVRTASGSTAAIELSADKVVTMGESSQVQIVKLAGTPIVQLESGTMKVFSASDIQIAAKDTTLSAAEGPVDLELGYQADQLNLTLYNGAVRNGNLVIQSGNSGRRERDSRTYWAGADPRGRTVLVPNPTYYVYPYFVYGRPDPNAGKIVAPVVNNPTNPGYRPTQIVPPMSDPIRVPVTRP